MLSHVYARPLTYMPRPYIAYSHHPRIIHNPKSESTPAPSQYHRKSTSDINIIVIISITGIIAFIACITRPVLKLGVAPAVGGATAAHRDAPRGWWEMCEMKGGLCG